MAEAPAAALPGGFASFEELMREALARAERAGQRGEVPVGAVLYAPDGALLAAAANAPIGSSDPTAHAEIRCLRAACAELGNYRLEPGCVMAVTLEPCVMCLGALVHARLGTLVTGAPDPKTGAVYSRLDGANLEFFNHRFAVVPGVLAEDCGELLRDFFRARR